MKDLKLFHFEACPYCQKARLYLAELLQEDRYREIKVSMIDERLDPITADQYDYYYVPTFFLNEQKIHEGAIDKEQLRAVLEKVLTDVE